MPLDLGLSHWRAKGLLWIRCWCIVTCVISISALRGGMTPADVGFCGSHETTLICNCGGGCRGTGGACDCSSCGTCDKCDTCKCCRRATGHVPQEWLSRAADSDMFAVTGDDVPKPLLPNYGNGYVATQFSARHVFVAGLFNGKGNGSHRAALPFPFPLLIYSPLLDTIPATAMDYSSGAVLRRWRLNDAVVLQRTYAHRAHKNVLVVDITVDNRQARKSATIKLIDAFNPSESSPDVDLVKLGVKKSGHDGVTMEGGFTLPAGAECFHGNTRTPETPDTHTAALVMCRSVPPASITAPPRRMVRRAFVATIHTDAAGSAEGIGASSGDDDDAHGSSGSGLLAAAAVAEWRARHGSGKNKDAIALFRSNVETMSRLWQAHVRVRGDRNQALTVVSSQWNILLSLRDDVEQSTGPGGLGNNCYQGHVYWDTEQFMWPNLLFFHPNMSRAAINYRTNRVAQARRKALASGHAGLQFPWESAVTGCEVSRSPTISSMEIHISGDVALAVWQEYLSKRNKYWLRDVGCPVLKGVAQYYASRAESTGVEDGFSIKNVVGVDEEHFPVDDASYVNAVAAIALQNALKCIDLVGEKRPSWSGNWSSIANALLQNLPFDTTHNRHMDYAGMDAQQPSNGLGVMLLGYPLGVQMTDEVKRNDLAFYSTQWPAANAMYWWAVSVAFNALGDVEDADRYFKKITLRNVFGPFHVWTENPGGFGCPNFITGAGAYLQAIWAGYGGLRLMEDRLRLDRPRPPPSSSSLSMVGIFYAGGRFDVHVSHSHIKLSIHLAAEYTGEILWVHCANTYQELTKHPISFPSPAVVDIFPPDHHGVGAASKAHPHPEL